MSIRTNKQQVELKNCNKNLTETVIYFTESCKIFLKHQKSISSKIQDNF